MTYKWLLSAAAIVAVLAAAVLLVGLTLPGRRHRDRAMSDDRPEPPPAYEPAPEPTPQPWRLDYRSLALALGGALIAIVALVATAPLWAPLLPWAAPLSAL